MIPQKFEVFADNLGPGSERLPVSRRDCEGKFDLESTGRMRLHTDAPPHNSVALEPVSPRPKIRELALLREIAKGSH